MKFTAVMKDERGFVHKKLLGLGKSLVGRIVPTLARLAPQALSFIPGGSVFQRGLGLISGVRGSRAGQFPIRTRGGQVVPAALAPPLAITTPRPTPPRTQTARVTAMSQEQKQIGLRAKFLPELPSIPDVFQNVKTRLGFNGNGGGNGRQECEFPLVPLPDGGCEFPGSPRGAPGEARMGRYGAALDPMFRTINKRECLPGMILGKDLLCYNKGAISNKERLWPKGTAPLLTGGEMAAIRKADTARGKVARTAKRLGIQPVTRRATTKRHAHAKAATGVVNV